MPAGKHVRCAALSAIQSLFTTCWVPEITTGNFGTPI
jgi:hypothetical protein